MKDRPIIFSAPMVRALLDGRKTMTRRLATSFVRVPDPVGTLKLVGSRSSIWQKVEPGDRLWVRETWSRPFRPTPTNNGCCYLADYGHQLGLISYEEAQSDLGPWTSPIHMFRWASRLTLIVTATKIEKVQSITDAEALAEGITGSAERLYGVEGIDLVGKHPRSAFAALWSMLHGYNFEGWDANPEVVALTFIAEKKNIDAIRAAA